jgi:hypothetical protein
MFLPDYVESGFAHATIERGGRRQPLVKGTRIIYESVPEDSPFNYFHPLIIFSVFLVVTAFISYRDIKRKKLTNVFDGILFGVVGVLGICLVLLWTVTSHQAAAKNFNLLWALPTHLIAVIAFIRQPVWLSRYFLFVAILTGLLLVSWPLLPQKLNYALIPLVVALGLRSFVQYRIRQQVR